MLKIFVILFANILGRILRANFLHKISKKIEIFSLTKIHYK